MNKIKLAIIFGGKSSEYLISLHSASSIINNVSKDKYEIILIGITEQGKWLYYPGNTTDIDNNTWYKNKGCCEIIFNPNQDKKGFIKLLDNTYEEVNIDCIFPVLHGQNVEDGRVQALFDLCNIPYVGCGMLSSALCMDKDFTHIVCEDKGIKMAPYMTVKKNQNNDLQKLFNNAIKKLSLPIIIKPANAGSSYGISKIRNFEDFVKGLNLGFEYDNKVILETTIDGFEIGCAILGNDKLSLGEVDEIEMYKDFFDYDEKYHSTTSKIHCPARVSNKIKKEAKEMAINVYNTLQCKGMARIDMFVDKNENLYLNEINTIPGLTSVSRYPSMVREGLHMNYTELIDELVSLCLQ